MTDRDRAALRRSIWRGVRTIVMRDLLSLDASAIADVWCDGNREWRGREVIEECRNAWARFHESWKRDEAAPRGRKEEKKP